MKPHFTESGSRNDLCDAVAERICSALNERLRTVPRASLIVSGGSTPGPVYNLLSEHELDWHRIDLCLTDERCVPGTHEASNERMVREHLLINRASEANFVPLDESATIKMDPIAACTLVGMGEDGHFASLFPNSSALPRGLDLTNDEAIVRVTDAPDNRERISMTLRQLTSTEKLFLLAFGTPKKKILGAPLGYPVEHLFAQERSPLHVFWAP